MIRCEAVEPRLPAPGDTIAGKYRVLRVLGEGGMGHVVEAQHLRLDQTVAIKLLLPVHATREEAIARFEREATAVVRLRSEHVTKVLDVDVDTATGLPFIVMERLEGRDLASEIARRKRIPTAEAVDWMLEACAGLRDAHALGIVHRDIKPSNLFVVDAPAGAPRRLKVMDFGVSKLLRDDGRELTTSNETIGTPSYMAPEQLLGSRAVDGRADLFAMAVVLYRMLSGRLPFTGETSVALAVAIATQAPRALREVAPEIDERLAHVVMRALARDPNERPSDVVELAALLAPFGTGRVAPLSNVPSPCSSTRAAAAPEVVVASADPTRAAEPTVIDSTPPFAARSRTTRPRGWRAATALAIATCVLAIVAGLAWSREGRHAEASGAATPPVTEAPPVDPVRDAPSLPAAAPPPIEAHSSSAAPSAFVAPSRVRPRAPVSSPRLAPASKARPPAAPPERPVTSDAPLHL